LWQLGPGSPSNGSSAALPSANPLRRSASSRVIGCRWSFRSLLKSAARKSDGPNRSRSLTRTARNSPTRKPVPNAARYQVKRGSDATASSAATSSSVKARWGARGLTSSVARPAKGFAGSRPRRTDQWHRHRKLSTCKATVFGAHPVASIFRICSSTRARSTSPRRSSPRSSRQHLREVRLCCRLLDGQGRPPRPPCTAPHSK
jgi:hypothetical protein